MRRSTIQPLTLLCEQAPKKSKALTHARTSVQKERRGDRREEIKVDYEPGPGPEVKGSTVKFW
jgi:hypothetical protein